MKPSQRINELNGYELKDNWYQSALINSDEQDVAALHESWGTADKYRGEECGRCRGRGYTRKDGGIGCVVCTGLGVIPEGEKRA